MDKLGPPRGPSVACQCGASGCQKTITVSGPTDEGRLRLWIMGDHGQEILVSILTGRLRPVRHDHLHAGRRARAGEQVLPQLRRSKYRADSARSRHVSVSYSASDAGSSGLSATCSPRVAQGTSVERPSSLSR